MSRRSRRHDALGEKVADQGLNADLNRALAELSRHEWLQVQVLLFVQDRPIEDVVPELSKVRHDRELFDLLSTYLDGRKPRLEDRCFNCLQALPPRAPGAPGRPAEYCGSACRQKAYRNRNRKNERYREMLRTTRLEAWLQRNPWAQNTVPVTVSDIERAAIEKKRAPGRAKRQAKKLNRLPPPDGL
ncbi:hypothetical protein [Nocardia sp. IFM 10818]